MRDVNGLVSLTLNSLFVGNDVLKVKKCIAGYTREDDIVGKIKNIAYMMKEAVYGYFGKSDRQIAKKAITDRAFSVFPLGYFINKEDFDGIADKFLSVGSFVNKKAPNVSESTYRTAFTVVRISIYVLQKKQPQNLVTLYKPTVSQVQNLKKDYGVFGLAADATIGQVKKAYIDILKSCHPDKIVRRLEESLEAFNVRREQLTETFKIAKDAYKRIVDSK